MLQNPCRVTHERPPLPRLRELGIQEQGDILEDFLGFLQRVLHDSVVRGSYCLVCGDDELTEVINLLLERW